MSFYRSAYLCLDCVQTAIVCTFCTTLCASCCAAEADAAQRRRGRESETTVIVLKDSSNDKPAVNTNDANLPLLPFSKRNMEMGRL